MSDDPRVTVPAELVERFNKLLTASKDTPELVLWGDWFHAARALVDATERPAAPVSEPLCRCGHEVGLHYMQPGEPPTCIYCGCTESGRKSLAPVPVSDEAEAPRRLLTTDDERDRLFEASGHTSSGEGWSALIDVVESILAARQAGKDEQP